MDDMNAMNREMKKQQLRRQIVPNPGEERPKPPSPYPEEDEEEAIKKAHHKVLRHRLVISLVIVLVIAAIAGGVQYWKQNHQYTEYGVAWETDLLAGDSEGRTESSSFTGYVDFGGNVVKYTKDGASYIDAKGKTIWVQTYEMKAPIAVVNGDYIAIADQQGNSIYICDKSGCQGTATTLLPILKVSVSAKGVAAAILEDAKANYITMFRKDGEPLDITVKARLSGDGYPLDLSLSPDGTELICSYAYMNNGLMDSRVVFYNFSEIGKNASPKRIVGGFDEPFSGSLVPRVHFMTDTESFACSDKGLAFFSTKNLVSPELTAQAAVESEILSLFYSAEYVGIIAANQEGEAPYRMEIYNSRGELELKKEFAFPYQHASISDGRILLWNENSFQAYNMAGTLKFEGTFDDVITKVTAGRFPNSYIITGPQKMREITLQR
ncbi:MAG: DUF5711 family protein [Lachnospiraceae bacterium]|nr:DUF5711 family protein [Lachnospiraceae bacterium]